MSAMLGDQRRFRRIPFVARVLAADEEGSWTCRLLDLSLRGALLERPPEWGAQVGKRYHLRVALDDAAAIEMDARACHLEERRVGLRCEHIDLESMSHLKRLVELNLGDARLLERELEALLDTAAGPVPAK